MIHSRWSGTHYEAGLSYGQALREQGIDPFVHFRQSKARLAFTRASIPLYETFYPAVLDEIWGMADGAGRNVFAFDVQFCATNSLFLLCILCGWKNNAWQKQRFLCRHRAIL